MTKEDVYEGAIGIDLGTTNSCVGVWQNDRVEILMNSEGKATTPSYVAFSDSEGRLVGEPAKNQCARNPTNTIFDAKRLIGRDFADPHIKKDLELWPFKVVEENGNPKLQVDYQEKTLKLSPEAISGMVLQKMKETAEAALGKKVSKAVVTVPAYFNDAQRKATKSAGAIAGLEVLRIINEPTAAAIAYGLDSSAGNKNVLIFDLGGGTFDVSLLSMEDGIFQVKATAGDTHLGGEDLDNNLVAYCQKMFLKKHKMEIDSARSFRRLRTACEAAKRALSSQTKTTIEVDALYEGVDFRLNLSRAKFEELNNELFQKCMDPVERVLSDAKMERSKVNEVVLVGGSTRIPKIQKMLSDFFGGKELNKTINPDEAVAYGAAVQAAILTGQRGGKTQNMLLLDVVPLSMGVEMVGGVMSTVIHRNSTIPCRETKVFTTVDDNQTAVDFPVYEGERKFTRDNNLLGEFTLTGIPPAKRGVAELEVTFDVDANGILTVTAVDKGTGKKNNITINKSTGTLSKEEIDQMIEDAKKFKDDDRKMMDRVKSRNRLQEYCYQVQATIDDDRFASTFANDGDMIQSEIDSRLDVAASNELKNKEEYESLLKSMENLWDPYVRKLYR